MTDKPGTFEEHCQACLLDRKYTYCSANIKRCEKTWKAAQAPLLEELKEKDKEIEELKKKIIYLEKHIRAMGDFIDNNYTDYPKD